MPSQSSMIDTILSVRKKKQALNSPHLTTILNLQLNYRPTITKNLPKINLIEFLQVRI